MHRIGALVLLVVCLAAADARAGVRVEGHTYVGAIGDAGMIACPVPSCPAEFLGGVSFALEGDERVVTISVADQVSPETAGFFRLSGDTEVSGAFCGTVTVAVPAGAFALTVYVSEAMALVDCGGAQAGSVGTVTGTFS